MQSSEPQGINSSIALAASFAPLLVRLAFPFGDCFWRDAAGYVMSYVVWLVGGCVTVAGKDARPAFRTNIMVSAHLLPLCGRASSILESVGNGWPFLQGNPRRVPLAAQRILHTKIHSRVSRPVPDNGRPARVAVLVCDSSRTSVSWHHLHGARPCPVATQECIARFTRIEHCGRTPGTGVLPHHHDASGGSTDCERCSAGPPVVVARPDRQDAGLKRGV